MNANALVRRYTITHPDWPDDGVEVEVRIDGYIRVPHHPDPEIRNIWKPIDEWSAYIPGQIRRAEKENA